MYVLQFEHPVVNFESWKKVFDSDPIGREQSGVRRYRIFRPQDNQNYVIGELEFDSADKAAAMLAQLRRLWGNVEGKLIEAARGRVVEVVESRQY